MNLSVLVGTCDKYYPLLEAFQICFNRSWELDTENFFLSETKDVPIITPTHFNTIFVQGNWGERVIKGLEEIQSDYVFFILDDYFFTYKFTHIQIQYYLNFCHTNRIDRLQISPSGHQKYSNESVENFNKFTITSPYLISMQPSIWSKAFLLEILEPEYSPWDFEIKGSNKLKGLDRKIFIDNSIPYTYFNGVRKGMRKSPGWKEFFSAQNIKEPSI